MGKEMSKKFSEMNYVEFRELAKNAYEGDRTDEALEYFKMAYIKIVEAYGFEPTNAAQLEQDASDSWARYDDDDAYDYYKAAYNIVLRLIEAK